MKKMIVMTAVALSAFSLPARAQTAAATAPARPEQAQPAPPASAAPASDGLSDLSAMTFGCPKAALNAAAREAAKAPSQGTYQFSYFKLVNDSHHASYEVHFKSNYQDEPELQYCVAIYCQQGWDPTTTRTSVTLMSRQKQPASARAHADACHPKPVPATRQKR